MVSRESATSTDPIRRQVETALLGAVRGTAAAPCALARRAWGTVSVPIGLTRSMVDLLLEGVLGRSSAPSDGHTSTTSAESSPTTKRRQRGASAADAGLLAELPIEDYESLAASQVIARLERMSPDELKRIRTFELASRGRRTVIGKIDRLLSA